MPSLSTIIPNLYRLHGHNLRVTYSTTSVDGKPRFHYQSAIQSLDFSGDQIRALDSEIGTLVTVTIHLTVDSGSTSFTLLVPRIQLGNSHQSAHVNTFGITTLHRLSLVPSLDLGQTELYTVTNLVGTAALVSF
jgi:hypothetical protein